MSRITFAEGLEVSYRGMDGRINFVCDHYITICVRTFEERVRNVNLIVYPDHYDWVKLNKESEK